MTEAQVTAFLKRGGATDADVEEFLNFVLAMTTGNHGAKAKKVRFECYKIWARLLRHRRSGLNKHGYFNFPLVIKSYLRQMTGPPVVDNEPPAEAHNVTGKQFVEFVVRHLEEF